MPIYLEIGLGIPISVFYIPAESKNKNVKKCSNEHARHVSPDDLRIGGRSSKYVKDAAGNDYYKKGGYYWKRPGWYIKYIFIYYINI